MFISDVKKIDQSKFDYEIGFGEAFKGNLKVGQIIKGTNPKYCSPFIDTLGELVLFN